MHDEDSQLNVLAVVFQAIICTFGALQFFLDIWLHFFPSQIHFTLIEFFQVTSWGRLHTNLAEKNFPKKNGI